MKLLALFLFCIVLFSCDRGTDNANGGGTSVETENVITATLQNENGSIQAGIETWLCITSCTDSLVAKDTSDTQGRIEFKSVPSGTYVLQIFWPTGTITTIIPMNADAPLDLGTLQPPVTEYSETGVTTLSAVDTIIPFTPSAQPITVPNGTLQQGAFKPYNFPIGYVQINNQ